MGHLKTQPRGLDMTEFGFITSVMSLSTATKKPRPRTTTLRLRMPNSNQEARGDQKESFEMSIWAGKTFHQIKKQNAVFLQEVKQNLDG